MSATPGPWVVDVANLDFVARMEPDGYHYIACTTEDFIRHSWEVRCANARLIAAAPDLLAANQLQEAAEHAHANCEECDGQGVPELCPKCFPLFDDARVARRAAIAKAQVAA